MTGGLQQFTAVQGIDFTLPAGPPLVDPPLSLLGEARTLSTTDGLVQRRQQLVEKMASAAEQLHDPDTTVDHDEVAEQMAEWEMAIGTLDDQIKEMQRWEHGFQYLPELGNAEAVSTWAPDSGTQKVVGNNQDPFYWYDPFVVVGHDNRSAFGWPGTSFADRVMRARRALLAHESWQAEQEFWSGVQIPTNFHLTASPNTPASSPHRTISPFPNPTPAPGTVLGTAVGLTQSLSALDQAIADADAGVAMIHATPYVIQQWFKTFPYLRGSDGFVRTVNNNIVVPGYGYGGTGPDQADRSETDGVTAGTTTFTSATAAFTAYDIGRKVTDGGTNLQQARTITGVGINSGTTIIDPASSFVAGDVGKAVTGVGINSGTTIVSVTNASTAVLSENALESETGVTVTVGTDTYIVAVASGTSVTLSQPALTSTTGVHFTIHGLGGRATGSTQQWAYATEMVFHLEGDVITYPYDLRELSPDLPVNNNVPVRAERNHALITNRLLRAAVLVDTTVA